MADQRHLDLLAHLLEQTRLQRLDWRESVLEDGFEVQLADYAVEVGLYRNEDGDDGLQLTIRDGEERIVEQITDRALGLCPVSRSETGRTASEMLSDLHGLARRQALHSDRALEAVLSTLSSLRDPAD
ncbi:MAG: hypothetical protein IT204_10125 [Fimbriimonadaceae bacterium]|nr:hypothetical protein [Fimbriimonadaceae bacterium]